MANVYVKPSEVLNSYLKMAKSPECMTFTLQTWYRYMLPYIPFDTGTLASGMRIADRALTDAEALEAMLGTIDQQITFNAPYANRLYHGQNFNFNTEHHPLACAEWGRVSMDIHGSQITDEVAQFIKQRSETK